MYIWDWKMLEHMMDRLALPVHYLLLHHNIISSNIISIGLVMKMSFEECGLLVEHIVSDTTGLRTNDKNWPI